MSTRDPSWARLRRAFRAPGLLTSFFLLVNSATPQEVSDYTLQPGDELTVSVWGEEALQGVALLRPDGRFSFPFVGEIVGIGRTVSQIQAEMTEKLSVYIPEAVVTVSVTGIEGNRIYVIGQVGSPGSFVMNPRLSVLQALSRAGGLTAFASVNDIIIVRGTGTNQRLLNFAYNEVSRGRNLEQNVQLESGDVIIVP